MGGGFAAQRTEVVEVDEWGVQQVGKACQSRGSTNRRNGMELGEKMDHKKKKKKKRKKKN
jgi:hypothetical protein